MAVVAQNNKSSGLNWKNRTKMTNYQKYKYRAKMKEEFQKIK